MLMALAAIPAVARAGPQDGPGPIQGTHAARLDSLFPHARGVFLAEVTSITERDERPGDGDLYDRVDLRILHATGSALGWLQIVKASGGLMVFHDSSAARPPPPPHFTIAPGELKAGRRYWFVTAPSRVEGYPRGVAHYWPADSAGVPLVIERALEQDAYRWHPDFWPDPGITVGWVDEPGDSISRVRSWAGSRLLWERRLPRLIHDDYAAWYVHSGSELGEFRPPGLPDSAHVLMTEVRAHLGSNNRFGLPAGSWRIHHVLDLWTGRIVSSRVRVDQTPDVERVFQAYDSRTDRVTYERIQDFLRAGGASVGAEDPWLRRIERWFDLGTGRLTREEVSRFAQVREGLGSRSAWLKVDHDKGLAAGPPKHSSAP
jgi:hypothetical protein